MTVRIGTRGSKLALAQTATVCKKLTALGIEVEQKIISTQGDEVTGVPLHEIGKQGVFVRALDDAILNNEIDCAVHSMKDIPAIRPSGLFTSAILTRDSPADYLAYSGSISAIKIIGTSSTRRKAQLLRHDPASYHKRPAGKRGHEVKETRRRAVQRDCPCRGRPYKARDPDPGRSPASRKICPFPKPGHDRGREPGRSLAHGSALRDSTIPETRKDVAIERAVMEQVGAGCFTPMGIYCKGGHLIAEVLSLDGKRTERIEKNVETIDEARVQGIPCGHGPAT